MLNVFELACILRFGLVLLSTYDRHDLSPDIYSSFVTFEKGNPDLK